MKQYEIRIGELHAEKQEREKEKQELIKKVEEKEQDQE